MRGANLAAIPETRRLDSCSLCASHDLAELWSLPEYPFTEAFGPYDPDYPHVDQALMACSACHHVQLLSQVDPSYLYAVENYAYVPNLSPKYLDEYAFLEAFIMQALPESPRLQTLEFGANNLDFARRLQDLSESVTVCDPLLPESTDEQGFKSVSQPIEEAIAAGLLGEPNLVVARHTLEHIGDPVTLLATLFEMAARDAVLVFEVPSFEYLTWKLRFDSITHQHIHYFSRTSVLQMAEALDARISSLAINPRGSNGGSLLFSLTRSASGREDTELGPSMCDSPSVDLSEIRKSIDRFEMQMMLMRASVDWDASSCFGFGASLMLSTLDYHLRGSISDLEIIFDDDLRRHGESYKNVDVEVMSPNDPRFDSSGSFLITSLENSRAIHRRLTDLGVHRIISPLLS